MTDHLPECPTMDWSPYIYDDDRPICICDRLRACEQRIMSLNPVALGVLIAQRSRERVLNAAREAGGEVSEHLPQCWTQDIGGMKRASAESCAVCDAIRSAVADALHEYDKQTYERCAKHMRTARREALDAAREAIKASVLVWEATDDYTYGLRDAVAAIDGLRGES